HEDSTPSFNVSPDPTLPVPVRVRCHGGCSQGAVIAALKERGLWQRTAPTATRNGHQARSEVRRWSYVDPKSGEVLGYHCRQDSAAGKRMWWERPDGTISRNGHLKPSALPLLGAAEVLQAPADQPVVIAEGEAARDAAKRLGVLAVTAAGGASQTDFGDA